MDLVKCYVCLEQNHKLIPVNEANENDLTVFQKLQIVVPFQDWQDCNSLCSTCYDLLNMSYRFICLCSKFESEREEFKQKLQEKSSQESENDKISINDSDEVIISTGQKTEIITIKIEPSIGSLPMNNSKIENDSDIDSITENEDNSSNDFSIDSKVSKCIISNVHGFQCKTCGKAFKTKGSLGQHIRLEHPKKMSCEICGESFLKLKTLIKHCMNQHSLKMKEIKPYTCEKCQRRFRSFPSLTRHIQYREGTKNYTCKVCGKCFVTKKDVDMHELIHGNEKNYCCKSCGKCFKTLSNLCSHMNCVHSDPSERKYECYICSKKFTLKASMEEHIKRHLGLKEHVCLICSASFIAKYDLKRHTYFHTKDRPFKCTFCENKSYRDGKSLKQHIEKFHSASLI